MWKFLRWAGLTVVALVFLVAAGVGGFVALGIPIELSRFKAPVEQAATLALGRKVRIDGAVSLAPSLEPTLQIEGVHVANADGWSEPDLIFLGLARFQLAVMPLLDRRIEVIEIAVDGFQVNLERAADGGVNWLLERQAQPSESTDAPSPDKPPSDTPMLTAFEVADLSLDNIVVSYRDAETGAGYQLTLDSIDGSAVHDQPMDLSIDGTVQAVPYTIAMSAGSLSALMRGDESWPLTLSMTLLGATLDVEGNVAEPLRFAGLQATFSLSGDDLQDLEAFVGEDLPPVAGYSFTGRVAEEDTAFALTDFEGRLGEATFSGAFSVDPSGELPEFRGRLDIPSIDLGPVFAAIESGRPADDRQQASARDGEAELDLEQPFLTLDGLRAFTGAFDMTVSEVAGVATSIRSAALSVTVADGVLRAPMNAEIADVGFSGELVLDGASDVPQASVALQASETDIGDLALALFDVEGIDGGFQSAGIDASVQGESIRELLRSLEFAFALNDAALSYGNRPGEAPVGFTLDAAEMMLPRGDVLQVTADGTVLEEPFSLAMTGGDIAQLTRDQRWPLELSAEGGGASLSARGTVTEQALGESSLSFELEGDRIGELARWLGVSPEATAPYRIEGSLRYDATSLSVPSLSAQVGETVLQTSYSLQQQDTGPLTTVSLSSDLLAVDELGDLFPQTEDPSVAEANDDGVTIDVPILPGGIEFKDADIELTLAQVRTRSLVLSDVSFTGNIRDGQVKNSPFGATVVGARLDGSVSLDLTGAMPRSTFAIATEEVDIGRVLSDLGVIEGLQVQAGRMSLDLVLEGVTARQMMERSRFQARIANGGWTLRDPNLDGSLEIGLRESTITAAPDQPVAMVLEGDIEAEPVTIKLDTAPLAAFTDEKDSLPVNLEVALAGAVLSMDAVAGLPIETQGLRFRLDLRGDSLDSFDELLEASLPPLGPYAIGGDFTVEPESYRIEGFSLNVGESRMSGRFELATAGVRPRLDIDLTTDTLQLDDFRLGDWSPLADEDAEETAPKPDEDAAREETKEQVRALLSREVMRSLDAGIDLKVDEVLSGTDELGSGDLAMTLQDGRFEVAPLVVNIPGGSTEIELAYEPLEESVQAEARARVEKLDYGVLARRIDPESDVGGLISVDIELTSEAGSLETVMADANGHLDFAVWPKDLEASLFDLWAVNLVTSVLPSVDSENESKFNCIIARFKVEDGVMTPEAILVDSSRIQASGRGNVDFKKETVDFTLAPKAKRPQMFSANTPIAVNGSFDDFGVGIAPGGLVGTVVRFTTSPVTTPFLWVFSTPVAEDGVEACAEAWAREPEDLLKEVKDPGAPDAEQRQ